MLSKEVCKGLVLDLPPALNGSDNQTHSISIIVKCCLRQKDNRVYTMVGARATKRKF